MEQTYTTTLTSKGQMTVPQKVRKRLTLGIGTKMEISLHGFGFVARPAKKPRILKLAGSLKKYDDGRSWAEIRYEAHRLAAIEILSRDRSRDRRARKNKKNA